MQPSTGPDFEPGPETTLEALYALLPETEEIDLAAELHAEQFATWARSLFHDALPLDPVEEYDDRPHAPEEGEEPPTVGQALGLLEHILGATTIGD
ncbi:hypothetical protein GCM10022242_10050 [Nocardioides panacisoli]|uniref:Uncharacterized protein n=2 Tax=Nocardioides panacisoli TaxID=627624 RepID=A0ABP7I127_9ACTN